MWQDEEDLAVNSTLAAKLKERLKTPQQYIDVMTALKRETRQRALHHAATGNLVRADEIIGKWNEYQDPDFWIDYIDSKTLNDYLKRKRELRENP